MWEDIKERLNKPGMYEVSLTEVRRLLADAEALLAVVRALEETNILIANTSRVAGLRAAHLALPAHLREQGEG